MLFLTEWENKNLNFSYLVKKQTSPKSMIWKSKFSKNVTNGLGDNC